MVKAAFKRQLVSDSSTPTLSQLRHRGYAGISAANGHAKKRLPGRGMTPALVNALLL